jgi:hypothetical protein
MILSTNPGHQRFHLGECSLGAGVAACSAILLPKQDIGGRASRKSRVLPSGQEGYRHLAILGF